MARPDDASKRARPSRALRLGGWEWIGLPEFGISCMRARLDVEARTSRLTIEDLESIDLDGLPGARFRIHPLPDDPRTYVLAEALLANSSSADRSQSIRTVVVLAEHTFEVELELLSEPAEGPPLILARGALGPGTEIDPAREALAGPPRLASTRPTS